MGAPLNPVPQVVRVFIEGFVDNDTVQKWGNVLHFAYTGGAPSNLDCETLATHISSEWGTHMAPECPSPTSLRKVTVTDLTSDSAGAGEALANTPGTRGDDSIPANAAVLITYPSGLRYKGGHPRSYLYCLGNADLEGAANWNPSAASEVQGHWQAFLTSLIGYGFGAATVASVGFVRYRGKYRPNGGPPNYYLDTPLYQSIVIDDLVAQNEMASQRRRIGRRRS